MYVVMLAVKFHQRRLEVFADAGKNPLHCVQMFFLEHVPAIFGNEYQVCVQGKNAVPTVP